MSCAGLISRTRAGTHCFHRALLSLRMTNFSHSLDARFGNTTTRILTALVGIPVIMGCAIVGGWWFFGFVQIITLLTLKEWFDLSTHKQASPLRIPAYIAVIALGFIMHLRLPFAFVMVWCIATTILMIALELWRNLPNAVLNSATTVFGLMSVGLCLQCLDGIRNFFTSPIFELNPQTLPLADTHNTLLLAGMFVGIWICDSAAFFVGKAIGKHKLFPRVSPKKSWEGAIAGFVASAIAFWQFCHYQLPMIPEIHAIILGGLIGIIGQIGDLAESLYKRDAGIKDSSNLIPGHGGFYDRFDSALFVAPLIYLYLIVLFKIH
jgi:phosphatidate cytidylyltransferase